MVGSPRAARPPELRELVTLTERRWGRSGDSCWEEFQLVTQLLFEVCCPRRTVLMTGLRSRSQFPRVQPGKDRAGRLVPLQQLRLMKLVPLRNEGWRVDAAWALLPLAIGSIVPELWV